MKKGILFLLVFFMTNLLMAQNYTHPTSGMGGEFVGDCMENTSSGTYYDDGGSGGNYSANVNNIYRTFCPDVAGECIQVTFTNIDFWTGDCIPGNTPCDRLLVIDGATQNDPDIGQIDYTDNGNTVTFTASSDNGCLTFRFRSISSSGTGGGWEGAITTVTCTANTTGNTNTDCINAELICANAAFTGTSTGPGLVHDGCDGCNTSEHYTNWYEFCIQTSGTLEFVVTPTPNSQDYDYALYGPGVNCGSLGTPLRCSYAAGSGNTGLSSSAGDNNENVTGDGWTNTVNVSTGECYYLMVNKWDAGGQGFVVDFTASTASLDCSVLKLDSNSTIPPMLVDKEIVKKPKFYYSIIGKKINDIHSYSGMYIIIYEDDTRSIPRIKY